MFATMPLSPAQSALSILRNDPATVPGNLFEAVSSGYSRPKLDLEAAQGTAALYAAPVTADGDTLGAGAGLYADVAASEDLPSSPIPATQSAGEADPFPEQTVEAEADAADEPESSLLEQVVSVVVGLFG